MERQWKQVLALIFGWDWYGFCGMVGKVIELRGWKSNWEPGTCFEAFWAVEFDGKARSGITGVGLRSFLARILRHSGGKHRITRLGEQLGAESLV
jgi:hypothetical protein